MVLTWMNSYFFWLPNWYRNEGRIMNLFIYLLHLWVSAFIRSIFVSYCIYSICEYDSDYSVKFFDGRCPQTFPILRGGRSIRTKSNSFFFIFFYFFVSLKMLLKKKKKIHNYIVNLLIFFLKDEAESGLNWVSAISIKSSWFFIIVERLHFVLEICWSWIFLP